MTGRVRTVKDIRYVREVLTRLCEEFSMNPLVARAYWYSVPMLTVSLRQPY
jgi:hypothetical protein